MAALREVVLPALGVQAFRRSSAQADPNDARPHLDAEGAVPERLNARTPERPSRLVIFLDEIDVVQSLPFSADEFFAGIRECYTRRAQEPALERLTFCLLGVASPTDLIQDTRITPFNIGRRIELTDFTEAHGSGGRSPGEGIGTCRVGRRRAAEADPVLDGRASVSDPAPLPGRHRSGAGCQPVGNRPWAG
jgi:hypothetical protein